MAGLIGSSNIHTHGFAIISGVFGQPEVDHLKEELSILGEEGGTRTRNGAYGARNLLAKLPSIAAVAGGSKMLNIAAQNLGVAAFPVRGILFDKNAGANWLVPWHQDLTVCVRDRIEITGYGPWTKKAGCWHVQPPAEVLTNMLSVRIHLDDSDELNGALRVIPGSHAFGRLTSAEIGKWKQGAEPVSLAVRAGDCVLMKPLLLHASSAAVNVGHRRVVHIDYACAQLEGGLQWEIRSV